MRKTLLAISMLALLVVTYAMTSAQTVNSPVNFSRYKFVYNPAKATDTIMYVTVDGQAPLMFGYGTWTFNAWRERGGDSALYRTGNGDSTTLVDSCQITLLGARYDTGGYAGGSAYIWDSITAFNTRDSSFTPAYVTWGWPKHRFVGDSTYGAAASRNSMFEYNRIAVRFRWYIDDDGGGAHVLTSDTDSTFFSRPNYTVVVQGMRR